MNGDYMLAEARQSRMKEQAQQPTERGALTSIIARLEEINAGLDGIEKSLLATEARAFGERPTEKNSENSAISGSGQISEILTTIGHIGSRVTTITLATRRLDTNLA